MPLGDIALRQNDIVSLNTTNRDLSFVKIETALVAAFFGERNRKHEMAFPTQPERLSALNIANQKNAGQGNGHLRVRLHGGIISRASAAFLGTLPTWLLRARPSSN